MRSELQKTVQLAVALFIVLMSGTGCAAEPNDITLVTEKNVTPFACNFDDYENKPCCRDLVRNWYFKSDSKAQLQKHANITEYTFGPFSEPGRSLPALSEGLLSNQLTAELQKTHVLFNESNMSMTALSPTASAKTLYITPNGPSAIGLRVAKNLARHYNVEPNDMANSNPLQRSMAIEHVSKTWPDLDTKNKNKSADQIMRYSRSVGLVTPRSALSDTPDENGFYYFTNNWRLGNLEEHIRAKHTIIRNRRLCKSEYLSHPALFWEEEAESGSVESSAGDQACTGALIQQADDSLAVVTAAHCIRGRQNVGNDGYFTAPENENVMLFGIYSENLDSKVFSDRIHHSNVCIQSGTGSGRKVEAKNVDIGVFPVHESCAGKTREPLPVVASGASIVPGGMIIAHPWAMAQLTISAAENFKEDEFSFSSIITAVDGVSGAPIFGQQLTANGPALAILGIAKGKGHAAYSVIEILSPETNDTEKKSCFIPNPCCSEACCQSGFCPNNRTRCAQNSIATDIRKTGISFSVPN